MSRSRVSGRRRELPPLAWLWLPPLAFLAAFYFYPLGAILARSLVTGAGGTLALVAATLSSPLTLRALWFSTWQALASTALTLAIGLPAAYVLGRVALPGARLLRGLTAIPFVLPTVVVAAAFQALLGPRGWLNLALASLFSLPAPPVRFMGTAGAIILAHVFFNTTVVVRLVGDRWAQLSPRLGESATMLGAGRLRRLLTVTLPLLRPAVLAAALLVFMFDFTSFGAVLLLGGGRFATLEVEIYYQSVALFDLPAAAVLSVLQLVITVALSAAYGQLVATRTGTPSPTRHVAVAPRGAGQKLATAAVVAVLVALLVTPLIALLARAVLAGDGSGRVTLERFAALAVRPRGSALAVPALAAVRNSLLFAAATAVLSLAVALPAAIAATTLRRAPLARLADTVAMLPLGTSAVTIGLGFIVALGLPWLDLRTSPLLIPIGHTLVALPLVFRSLSGGLRAIPRRLHDAAATLGASAWQQLWRVDLPLAARPIATAALYALAVSLGEFGATALIARPELPTITTAIFRALSRPGAANFGQGMALGSILMVLTAAAALAVERLRGAVSRDF